MAYFDNPVYRENWEKALAELREERDRRIKGAQPQDTASIHSAAWHQTNEERIPITFQQLLDGAVLSGTNTEPTGLSPESTRAELAKTNAGYTMAGPGPEPTRASINFENDPLMMG
ncbi:MAG: hypothetical protein FWH02_04645 [Oscillospiraceae bacterium]|nr:hypothetical protein [Oscillospiraceae bacterium]